MRDQLRTPQQLHKLPNRKLKWSSEQSRSPKKIVKQILDSVIALGSDDVSINLGKDCDDVQVDESSVENFINSSSTAVSPSTASADLDLSPLCSTITSNGSPISSDLSLLCSTPTGDASPVSSNLSELSSTITSDKVETNDVKVNRRNNLPDKRDWFSEIAEKKVMTVLRKVFLVTLTFMLLIICVGVFIFSSDDGSSYNGLVPT